MRVRITYSMFRAAVLMFTVFGSLAAAPRLRLSAGSIGPYSIAAGVNGSAQTVEAWNAGDGSLSLQLSSSASWAVPAPGAARPCATRAGTCLPIQIAFPTASLAKGMYTATVTVADPNAVDAPQTITVTAQIGGGVPDRLELYAAPTGAATARMTTNQFVYPSVATQDGRPWLAIASGGVGSFTFGVTHTVTVTPQSGMGAGDYHGSIGIAGSAFAPDNKTVDVLLHVTSQPIAEASSSRLYFRIAQQTPKQTQSLFIANRGQGTLNVSAVTASGGSWLSAGSPGAAVAVTADPAGLAPGVYQGSLAISSNAVNGALAIPVQLEVVAQSPPRAAYRGTVNAATFSPDDPIGQGDIMALFGEQLLYGDPQWAPRIPLDTRLGNTRVLVNGQAVPLYYASYWQINFQMPFETPAGDALVRVERDGQLGNTIVVPVSSRGPRILPFGEYGVIQNASRDNTLPMPPTPGVPSERARPGDILVVYGFGFGATAPAVTTGAGAPTAEPLARLSAPVKVFFGPRMLFGEPAYAIPDYAGLAPYFVGVYQINVKIPENAPKGDRVPLWMQVGDGDVAQPVLIAVQ